MIVSSVFSETGCRRAEGRDDEVRVVACGAHTGRLRRMPARDLERVARALQRHVGR